GSWYASVIPHLLVPGLAAAIAASGAKRLVTLNLATELETIGLSLPDHLAALTRYLPALRVDVVLADGKAVGDPEPVHRAAESLGARLQIGRASCRERVEISGVAVGVKKKETRKGTGTEQNKDR